MGPSPGNWDVKAAYAAGKTSDPATFNPRLLNTTQWMESITGLGANIAILTAKHVRVPRMTSFSRSIYIAIAKKAYRIITA